MHTCAYEWRLIAVYKNVDIDYVDATISRVDTDYLVISSFPAQLGMHTAFQRFLEDDVIYDCAPDRCIGKVEESACDRKRHLVPEATIYT